MARRVAWRLDALQPEWVTPKDGWGHGVRWTCGLHQNHQLEVHFRNPCDGETSVAAWPLYTRVAGTSFSTLTLLERLEFAECFTGWIIAGELLQYQH